MFALNPNGSGGSAEGDASSSSSAGRQLYFFGVQLGIYFASLRMAYLFFSSRDETSSSTTTGAL
jgi:hypothetical protein